MPIFQYRFGRGVQQLRHLIAAEVTGPAYVTTIEVAWRRGSDYYADPWRGFWATELGGTGGDVGGGEAHVDHGIGADGLRLRHHPLERLGARLVEQLGVRAQLAADEVLQAREQVAADVLAAHGRALHEAEVADDGPAGDGFEVAEFHDGDRAWTARSRQVRRALTARRGASH